MEYSSKIMIDRKDLQAYYEYVGIDLENHKIILSKNSIDKDPKKSKLVSYDYIYDKILELKETIVPQFVDYYYRSLVDPESKYLISELFTHDIKDYGLNKLHFYNMDRNIRDSVKRVKSAKYLEDLFIRVLCVIPEQKNFNSTISSDNQICNVTNFFLYSKVNLEIILWNA